MISYAEQAPSWSPQVAHHTDITLALAGIGRWSNAGKPDAIAAILTEARTPWERWVSAQLEDSWFAERALSFFGTPPAEPVLEPILIRLAEIEPQRVTRYRSRYDEALGEMLAELMGRRPELFTSPGDSGTALRLLLSRLAERGSPLALELVARLA
jgi:hypothetical protein